MEIADVVSCEIFKDGDFRSRETAKIHIYQENSDICLHIETERFDMTEDPETATSVEIDQLDPRTLQRLRKQLSEWLQAPDNDVLKWRTRPLIGECRGKTSSEEINSLDISLSNSGLNIVGISSTGDPVEDAVRIPPTGEIHDGRIEDHNFIQRLHSMLEIFQAGFERDRSDILEVTNRLVHPERHLHSDLPEECLDRLECEDYKGVIQKAGEALEGLLENKAPNEIVDNTGPAVDLVARLFTDEDGFRWGYVPNEQEGLRFLYAGSFKALRNPTSHPRGDPDRNRYLDDICREDAIDALCLYNFLVRRLHAYSDMEMELDESEWG